MSNEEVTHILIADDDPHIRELVRLYFESAGFHVDDVEDGAQALERVALGGLDLLVLDVMLPGLDGWAVLKKIREQDVWLPVIMLTAAGAEDHRILGLELGADDYLTKPFSPRELVARVKAVLRRVPPVPVGDEAAVIHLPGLVLDASAHTAFCGHEQLALTPREFELLWFLAKHPRQVFSRAQLLDKVWGFDFEGDDRTVDVHITRLRKKLEATGTAYQYLETVWGHGYRLQPEPRA